MTDTLRITPAKPCCNDCVLVALTASGFDYTEPFVIYSGLAHLSARARRELVEQLVATGQHVLLTVSTPVPAECRGDENAPAAVADESAAPTAEELTQLLGGE